MTSAKKLQKRRLSEKKTFKHLTAVKCTFLALVYFTIPVDIGMQLRSTNQLLLGVFTTFSVYIPRFFRDAALYRWVGACDNDAAGCVSAASQSSELAVKRSCA